MGWCLPRSSRWLLIDQTQCVALGVGHHAPAEAVLPEVLPWKLPAAQGLNLGRRLLDVVDRDVQVEAVLEGLRLRDALAGDVGVVRACLRQTDVAGRFAQGPVDLETEDCTPRSRGGGVHPTILSRWRRLIPQAVNAQGITDHQMVLLQPIDLERHPLVYL